MLMQISDQVSDILAIPPTRFVQMCSVAQFTTDDIGLIWLNVSSQATAAQAFLRTLSSNSSYGILGGYHDDQLGSMPVQQSMLRVFWPRDIVALI